MPEDSRKLRELAKWDDESAGYDSHNSEYAGLYAEIIRRSAASLNKDAKVIEIGCGTGLVTFELARHVRSICGIDISEKMLAIARDKAKAENCDNVEFVYGDAYDLEYEDGSFDAVLMPYVLDIVEKPEVVLQEAHRLLNDSGVLISITDCTQDRKRVSSPRLILREMKWWLRSLLRGLGMLQNTMPRPRDTKLIRITNDAGFRIFETAIIDIHSNGEVNFNLYACARKF